MTTATTTAAMTKSRLTRPGSRLAGGQGAVDQRLEDAAAAACRPAAASAIVPR